jgi:ribosomal protein L7Ae-like RNA K-turn-binding protein
MNKVLSYLGLAQRAGKIVSGEFSTEKAIKSHKAFLVIVAEDASDNTKKSFSDAAAFYNIPLVIYGTKDELGGATGKRFRASLAVMDEGFAKAIKDNLE